MKQSPFGKPDVVFGRTIMTLRTTIGLTQAGLAEQLGISRQTVGKWEAGSDYPNAEHLKHLIELGIKQQAFPAGNEAEAIRTLWQAAHQKMLLDEQWLSSLLGQQQFRHAFTARLPVEALTLNAQINVQTGAPGRTPEARVDWGDAPALLTFYGREQEIALLTQWILQERCQVVSLLGMGGIGKSALAVYLINRLVQHFDVVIFRSLRNALSCEELLDSCLQALAPQTLISISSSLQQRIDRLLEYLRTSRTLLVLDNLESILQEGDVRGRLRPGFEGYGRLLRQVAQTTHQSCLLLTSREKLAELRPLEGKYSPVRSLRLSGLDTAACEQLFAENNVVGTVQEQAHLIKIYTGNPLALKIVVETILNLFDGEIGQFFAEGAIVFDTIADLLHEQLTRLSPLEQLVLYWLAIVRESITLDELQTALIVSALPGQILEAIDGLRRRSLIERGQRQGSFTLQSVVLEHVTTVLIEEATREIQQHKLSLLIQHSLEQASAREYIRQIQERLLVTPVLTALQSIYKRNAEVETQLLSLLDQLRERADYAQGYGPANLIALLRLHSGHLRDLNLSHLMIRDASLQGIEMQDASLIGSELRDTAFTDVLDATWAVAISRRGHLVAAGNRRGEVRVWKDEGRMLSLIWQAHTDNIYTLDFSPDECTLATGSWDNTVKLWDLGRKTLLWMGQHKNSLNSVAFSPSGNLLASCGDEELIRLWDVHSGRNIQILDGQGGNLYAMTWRPDGQQLACGYFDGSIRVWQMQGTRLTGESEILTEHTDCVMSLAFSPDGTQLASGSWDHTVKLWNMNSRQVYQTLTAHMGRIACVAWSPDGNTLASASEDTIIWLWDIKQSLYRAALHGHSAIVCSLAFTPNSRSLLSSSEDGTLRLWDIEKGECTHTLQGYAVSFYDIAWSPDGTQLASVGTDTQVTLWDASNTRPPKMLSGHLWTVVGVAWSPDGRRLASSGWDNAIRIWNIATGICLQVLRGPGGVDTVFHGLAWSPDGHLLASGSYMHGVQVWNVLIGTLLWIGHPYPNKIRCVAWSPDGTRLASGGDDGSISLWESHNGTLLEHIQEHHGAVRSLAWSADGSQLASGGNSPGGGEIVVWNVTGREIVRAWRELHAGVGAVVWSPGSNVLVSGESDGKMRWWKRDSGECLKTQEGHHGWIQALKISPDDQRLASCGDDGTIRIWNLESGELCQTLRRDRPYERMNITGIRGLTEAQKATLHALGAIEEDS